MAAEHFPEKIQVKLIVPQLMPRVGLLKILLLQVLLIGQKCRLLTLLALLIL